MYDVTALVFSFRASNQGIAGNWVGECVAIWSLLNLIALIIVLFKVDRVQCFVVCCW